MLDVRYHIVYLCAIFLSMGFGMLIGQHLALPAAVQQQTRTLQDLRESVDGAVQDGRIAKSRLEAVEQAVDGLRPALVKGKLAGKRVVVIQLGDYPIAASSAADALGDAGAQASPTVTIENRMLELSPDRKQAIDAELASASGGAGATSSPTATDSDLLQHLAHIVCAGAAPGSVAAAELAVYTDEDLITVDGDLSQPCSAIVIAGGRNADDLPDPAVVADTETDLIGEIATQSSGKIPVVGCEPLDASNSSIPTYRKAGIATVDCIDQPIGELALPFAFSDPDAYGLKPTAAHVLPQQLEAQTPS